MEHAIHQALERRGGIGLTKGYYLKLIVPVMSVKHYLRHIIFRHPHLII